MGNLCRVLLLALVCLLPGCASAAPTAIATTDDLMKRVADPNVDKADRLAALKEVTQRTDRPIASELTRISERLLFDARKSKDPKHAATSKELAAEVVNTVVGLGGRSANVLTLRLGDPESELGQSAEALDLLVKHEDATVRDMAKERQSKLKK